MAAVFGASEVTDAYLVATVTPVLVFGVVGSAISTVVVPVYTQYLQRSRREVGSLAWSSFNITLVGSIVIAIAGIAGAPWITRAIAPGLPTETFSQTVHLTRIAMPGIVMLAMASWANGILNAHKNFFAPSIGGVPHNLILICSIVLAGWFGSIDWVTWATVAAIGSTFLIQVPALKKIMPRYEAVWKHPGLVRMGTLAVPVLISQGAAQLNILIDRALSSGLEPGTISILNYAQKATSLPQNLIAIPVITVLFPTLADLAQQTNLSPFRKALTKGLTALLMVLMPLTALLLLLRSDVTRLLFERGAFTAEDTSRTAVALGVYGFGLLFNVGRLYLIRASYAMQDTWTPLWTGLATVGLKIGMNFALIGSLGFIGLALSTSLANLFSFVLLLWFIRRQVGALGGNRLAWETGKVLIATAVMVFVVIGLQNAQWVQGVWVRFATVLEALGRPNLESFVFLAFRLGFLGIVGLGVYVATCFGLRVEEAAFFSQVGRAVLKRLPFVGRK